MYMYILTHRLADSYLFHIQVSGSTPSRQHIVTELDTQQKECKRHGASKD